MKAKIIVNKNYSIGKIDERIYGSFIEHMGRAIYGGIYEPNHENADDQGFRVDVLELVKKLNVPIIRYPGGNFVSGYDWEDGIGDRANRPKKVDLAWAAVETNEIGIDEFQEWIKRANSNLMMAVNLGTRGPKDAQNLLEYCNGTTDTYYANLRRKNGFEEPFKIKTWCLGNEMDGPWQIGHRSAEEYGEIVAQTGKLMKVLQPDIELVACGSSHYDMPTFGDWELTVLDCAYEYVDYISMHQYYTTCDKDLKDFLSKSIYMDRFIKGVVSICDAVKAKKHSDKTVNISFDEWNIWSSGGSYHEKWKTGSPIFEDIYTFEDALFVGCMLMTLQNNCDRVKIACMAQLINVIAPIMTETGGGSWAQTIFYPFMYASINGRGTAMKPVISCDNYNTESLENVPYLETSIIHNDAEREIVVFAVNRSENEKMDLELKFEDFGICKIVEHIELYNDDLKSINSYGDEKVSPVNVLVNEVKSEIHNVTLKKHSWNMLKLKY